MTYKRKKITVVMPAYNEEKAIYGVVKDFSKPYVDELIVVDNNSTDKTAELARKAGAKVLFEKKQGYDFAVLKGLKKAKGDIIIITESEGTFVGADMKKLLTYIDDADMVLGTRTCKELVDKDANMGIFLRWGNIFVAKVLQLVYGGMRLTDVGCTFRVIKKKPLKKIIPMFTYITGSYLCSGMIMDALITNLKVIEIPVHYRKRIGVGKITSSGDWKAFTLGLEILRNIFKKKFFD